MHTHTHTQRNAETRRNIHFSKNNKKEKNLYMNIFFGNFYIFSK